MADKNYFLIEIEKSFKISKEFKKGYSTYGDRSEYLIKLIKNLKTSEEIDEFKEAFKNFLISGDKKKDRFHC